MMRSAGDDLANAAYHEAGHAVAYWDKGLTFRYVSIRGRRNDNVALWRPRRIRAWDQDFIAAAGPIAEMHHRGIDWDDGQLSAAITDDAEFDYEEEDEPPGDFATYAAAVGLYRSREHWVPIWRGHERQITGRLWPAVEVVARGLLASRRALTYADVASLAAAAIDAGRLVS